MPVQQDRQGWGVQFLLVTTSHRKWLQKMTSISVIDTSLA